MPTQSRGFFSCDYCGRQHDTEEEAREHELTQCRRRPGTGPPPAAYQQEQQQQQSQQQQQHQRDHPYYLATQQSYIAMAPLSSASDPEGYQSHHLAASATASPYPHHPSMMGMMMGGGPLSTAPPRGKDKAISLLNPHDRHPHLILEDNVACQNIEVFEASADTVAVSSRKQAQQQSTDSLESASFSSPVPKQIGMRCIHCVKYPQSAPPTTLTSMYRTVFPPSIASMADLLRKMADHHLALCRMAPPDVQETCQEAASIRSSRTVGGSEKLGRRQQQQQQQLNRDKDATRAALIDFCVGFCQQVGIVNKQQHKSGMEYIVEGGAAAASAGEVTPSMASSRPSQYTQQQGGGSGSAYLDRTMGGHEYPKQGPPPMYPPRLGMGPVGEGPAHGVAPTPLQRTRGDRPVEEAVPPSTGGNTPSTMGFPTPYSTQRRGGTPGEYSASGEMPTPAQPDFERRESMGGGGQRGDYPEQQQYDLPSNFPFYQERDRSWHCKFCASIHPQMRDPQSIWTSRDGGPPPGPFIDQHLHMCRVYQQGHLMPSPNALMHPAAVAGFGMPPPYGPGGWEQMPYPGMPPHHEFPFGYPPSQVPSHHEAIAAAAGRFAPDQDFSGGMYAAPRARASRGTPPPMGPVNAVVMSQAMAYLSQFDKEYYERDEETAAIPKLVLDEDRLLLTDYFFHLMKQLRLCRFSEADRKTRGGKREKIKIGYGGLQCIHCADLPMSRKFFWSNVDRLANSFAEIPGHVLKCKRCPTQCKEALMQLKAGHPDQMAKLPRGSQKVFFRRMWARLHDGDPSDENEESAPSPPRSGVGSGKTELSPRHNINTNVDKDSPESHKTTDISPSSGSSEETTLVLQRTAKEAAATLAASAKDANPAGPLSPSSRVLLAIPEDKEWLSEKDIFIRKQLEVFCATEEDVIAAQKDLKYPVSIGQVGIRCIHCALAHGSETDGHAVAFPFNISGINESVREIHRLHLDSCKNIPAPKKTKLANLGASSLSSVLRRYYILGAKALGLRDSKHSGIRSGGVSSPIGSQAAFTFADTEEEEEVAMQEDPKDKSEKDIEDSKPSAVEKKEEGSPFNRGEKRSSDTDDDSERPAKMVKTEQK